MRKHSTILSVCLAIIIVISAGGSSAAMLDKIRFPYSPIAWNSLLWFIAKDVKLFEKHGLDVDIFFEGASPLIVQAMLAGEVQFGGVGGPTVVTNVLQGGDVIQVAAIFKPFAGHGYVISRALSFRLDQHPETFQIRPFPWLERIQKLKPV